MLWLKNIDDGVGEILIKGAQTPPFQEPGYFH